MRKAAPFQAHTAGPLNYVDYDADAQIAQQMAHANQMQTLSAHKGFSYWIKRNVVACAGLILIAATAALTAALATWSINDPSLNYATSAPVQNALGKQGAITSDLLMQFFGLGSLIILLISAVWGWRLLFGHSLFRFRRRIFFSLAGLIFASGMASSLPVSSSWPLPMGLGGVVGDLMIWLPVAAFGSHFAGVLGLLVAAIFFVLAGAAFVCAVWSTKPAAQNEEPGEAAYFDPASLDEAIELESEPARWRAWFSLGALAHILYSLRAFVGRLIRKFFVGMYKVLVTGRPKSPKSNGTMPQTAQPPAQAAYQEDPSYHNQYVHEDSYDPELYADPLTDIPPIEESYLEEAQYGDEPAVNEYIPPLAPKTTPSSTRATNPVELSRVQRPKAMPKPSKRATKEAQPDLLANQDYELPSLHMLAQPDPKKANNHLNSDALEQNARLLEGVLEDFGVRGEIINVRPGPVVTLYELEPAPGIKSSRVIGLADDIARSMSAIAARVAVIPGRNVIGIELPNAGRETVYLREILDSTDFDKTKAKLALCLGKNIGGEAVIADLAKMPHLLVAGTTGSGKSVAINTMILSLLYRMTPEQCRLIMIDPKMLELSVYDGIPHLLSPVVTDPKKAVVALKWTVREMEDRYKKMSKVGVRNIDGYNKRVAVAKKKGEVITRTVQTGFDHETGEAIYEQEDLVLEPMPYIVVVIDEMADLMMVAGKEIEGTVQRLAQMARAAGIHVIMATQRPSVDVITGTIKANFPTRISFQVTSKIDSRTILGEQGAEQLLGMGDMLFMAGGGRVQRVHGPFVDDAEVEEIVQHLQTQGVPEYLDSITNEDEVETSAVLEAMTGGDSSGNSEGDLYDQAVAIVLRDKRVSTSYVQRRLSIGYNRAASIIEKMEQEGVISSANHAGKREILVGNAEDTI